MNCIKNKNFVIDAVNSLCRKEVSSSSNENYYKVRNHCHYAGKYRGAAHNIWNVRYKTPKEILAVLQNGSNYYYHFIIKELVKEFKGQFEWLGENIEKCITFSVPVEKELENVKKWYKE